MSTMFINLFRSYESQSRADLTYILDTLGYYWCLVLQKHSVNVIDLHVDIGVSLAGAPVNMGTGFSNSGTDLQFNLSNALKGGYVAVVAAIFPAISIVDPLTGQLRDTFGCSRCIAHEQVKVIVKTARSFSDIAFVVKTKDDLRRLHQGKLGMIIGMEGAYALSEPEDLIPFYEQGVRVLGLTWNVENGFAASCKSKHDYGLTGSGEELVRIANELGVVIDLAHASYKTMMDVLEVTKKPVVISHACAWSIRKHPRNVRDEVLDALRRNGGVMGVTFVPAFLTNKETATVNDVAKHILYIRDEFGPEILAIGTDYLGMEEAPAGLENASKIQSLFNILRELGMSESEIEGLAWRNALRVFERNFS